MNILIIRLSSMGDVIHTLPALRALRQSFPEARLGWAVEDIHSDLLKGLSEIDRLFIVPRARMRSTWRERNRVVRELKTALRENSWDIAVDFQGLWKSLQVTWWARPTRILGYAPNRERTHWFYSDPVKLPTMDRHAVDRNLDLVATLGASTRFARGRDETHRDFSLPVSPADRSASERLVRDLNLLQDQPKVLINFSARKPANKWGVERFGALVVALSEKGIVPVLTGGPGDSEEENQIKRLADMNQVPSLVGRCSLLELAAAMRHFDAMVTGDTGPMHIAVAMGLPVVALFGPANPVRTGPYSPEAIVIQKPRDCQPCYARHCKFGEEPPPCLLDIGVQEVVKWVEEIVKSRRVQSRAASVSAEPTPQYNTDSPPFE